MATLGEQARIVVTDHYAPVLQRLQEDIDRIILFHSMAGYSIISEGVTVREGRVLAVFRVPMGTLHTSVPAIELLTNYDTVVSNLTARLVENPHMFKDGSLRMTTILDRTI